MRTWHAPPLGAIGVGEALKVNVVTPGGGGAVLDAFCGGQVEGGAPWHGLGAALAPACGGRTRAPGGSLQACACLQPAGEACACRTSRPASHACALTWCSPCPSCTRRSRRSAPSRCTNWRGSRTQQSPPAAAACAAAGGHLRGTCVGTPSAGWVSQRARGSVRALARPCACAQPQGALTLCSRGQSCTTPPGS